MTDDELLASAYLDNQVAPDERARVESDPELVAQVERLQFVRDQLANTEPAPISVREDQRASAPSAWERLPDAERLGTRDDTGGADARAVAAVSAMSRPTRGRPRQRWLLAAAAALIVIVGAGVVLQQIDPTDNDDSVAEPAADDGEAGTEEAPAAEEAPGADADEVETGAEPADEAEAATEAGAQTEAAPEPRLAEAEEASDLAAADIEAESQAIDALEEEGGSTDELTHSAGAPDQPPGDDTVHEYPELTSRDQLISYASLALGATGTTVPIDDLLADEEETAADPVLPECSNLGVDVLVGPALYLGDVVMVGLDHDTNHAVAYDLDGCVLVESLPIPD